MTDDDEKDLVPKTFQYLHWGQEYCVSVKVEGIGSLSTSYPKKQCLQLPEEGKIRTIQTTALQRLTEEYFSAGRYKVKGLTV